MCWNACPSPCPLPIEEPMGRGEERARLKTEVTGGHVEASPLPIKGAIWARGKTGARTCERSRLRSRGARRTLGEGDDTNAIVFERKPSACAAPRGDRIEVEPHARGFDEPLCLAF
jgi:hypothetical protein